MKPYGPDRFSSDLKDDVAALWHWYDAAGSHLVTHEDGARLRAGGVPILMYRGRWKRAVQACERRGIDPSMLADRVEASARLRAGDGPAAGGDIAPFLDLLVGSFAEALARLKGHRGSWQRRAAADFAHGLVLTQYLLAAPAFAERGVSLFCRSELDQAGLTVRAMASREMPTAYRALAWKQSIRARDSLASARSLIVEMDLRERLYAKWVWHSALERLHALEKQDFDVWASKPTLGPIARTRVRIQSIFGRTAFRSA